MDQSEFKKIAKRLHAYLAPHLGVAFKLGHAQDVLSAIAGARNFRELRARPDALKKAALDPEGVERICRRVEQNYDTKADAGLLLGELRGEYSTYRTKITPGELPRTWICDVCHKSIDNIDRGYVIWKSSARGKDGNYKIIHKTDCDLDDHDSSMALRDLLGQQGLNLLLTFLSPGKVQRQFEASPRSSIPDLDEWVDLVRRVQIPYYDLVRPLFNDPEFIDKYGHYGGELTLYQPEILKAILRDTTHRH